MLRRLLADSALYSVAAAIPGLAGFVLLPIYTRFLKPEDYGVVDLVTLGYTIILVLATLEIAQGLARHLPEATDLDARRRLSSTAFWTTAFGVLAAALIAAFAAPWIAPRWLDKPDAAPLWQLGAITAWLTAMHGSALRQLRGSLRPRAYVVATLVTTVVTATATLLLLGEAQWGPAALLAGQACGSAAGLVLAWLLARGQLAWMWDKAAAKKMLAFSIPLVASTLGVLAASQASRWVVAHAGSLEAAGQFGIAARIASILSFAASGLQLSLAPLIYAMAREPGTPAALAVSFRLFAGTGLVLWSGLTLFGPEVLRVLATAEFAPAARLIGPIGAALLLGTATMFAPGLEIAHRTKQVAAVGLFAGALNLGLGWWWVHRFGAMGAGAAMCVSASVQAVLIFRLSQRYFNVPHHWPALGATAAIATLATFPTWWVSVPTWPPRLSLFTMVAVVAWYTLIRPSRLAATDERSSR